MKCLHCNKKSGKRFCPAYKGEICTVCCGKYRLVDISCPSSCNYLTTGQVQEQKKEDTKLKQQLHIEHEDKLQNIEFSIVHFAKKHNEVDDSVVYSVLETFIKDKYPDDGTIEQELADAIFEVIELRKSILIQDSDCGKEEELEKKIYRLCFEKIKDSVQLHSSLKQHDKSYINFVSQFVP